MSNPHNPLLVGPPSADDGGGNPASVPDLAGYVSDGKTPEEAVRSVQGALTKGIEEADATGVRCQRAV